MKRWARIRTRFARLHCWPTAPEEVVFLRQMHRHEFHITVDIEVFHNERDVEYILFKQFVDEAIAQNLGLASTQYGSYDDSCETMAERLITAIKEEYKNRSIRIEVSEDGENGAILEYDYQRVEAQNG